MTSARGVGRTVGLMYLAIILVAPPVYTEFGMMRSVIEPGFLDNAAGSATQIRAASLLLLALGGATLAIALAALPVFRRHSERMGLLFLALSIAGLPTQVTETVLIRTMVRMSQEYAKAGAQKELLQTLGAIVHSAWASAHFTNLLIGHITPFVFYCILYRFALVPRALAAAGLATSLIVIAGDLAILLLGYRFWYLLIVPSALTHLVLVVWLIAKGFDEGRPLRGGAGRAELSAA